MSDQQPVVPSDSGEESATLKSAANGKTEDERLLASIDRGLLPVVSGDPWRVFRIMGEFVEGFDTLAGIGPAVSIFGSGMEDFIRSDPVCGSSKLGWALRSLACA
jgi:hypothetical protein